jgi:hypothetical protein
VRLAVSVSTDLVCSEMGGEEMHTQAPRTK